MPVARPLSRRRLLALAGAATVTGGRVFAPGLSRAADRPQVPCGVQSGDVSPIGGVVWSRSDRPARMAIEVATTDSFRDVLKGVWVDALPETDFTAKALMNGLPPGQDLFYRVTFQNHAEPTIRSEPVVGRFRTAPADRRSVSFCWSADAAGQGWGIDLSRGGMRTFETIRRNRPDFFLHLGDNIYADNPILPEQAMPDGGVWKNLVIEEKTRPAQTLADFRANWRYNFLDPNVRALMAEVPLVTLWDDHEVVNNWWPEEPLTRAEHRRRGYTEPNMMALAARANRAFHEYTPTRTYEVDSGRVYRKIGYGPHLDIFVLDMRSYRGPNGENRQAAPGPETAFLGPEQIAWLKRELKASTATWKVIAADMPLSLYVVYDFDTKWGSEAVAQADDGPPLGREFEIADLLSFLKRTKIRNTVWLTADVHYTAAHYYDPDKAAFQDFEPFWEFVSGPLHAGTFGPNKLDRTFGPQLKFIKAPPTGQVNLPPSAGYQFFGHVAIEGATGVMTVTLKDVDDAALWSVALEPAKA
jgi:alkaline phosphatase D